MSGGSWTGPLRPGWVFFFLFVQQLAARSMETAMFVVMAVMVNETVASSLLIDGCMHTRSLSSFRTLKSLVTQFSQFHAG